MKLKILTILGCSASLAVWGGCAPQKAQTKTAGLNVPEIKGSFVKDGSVFISWEGVPGASFYDLYLACPGKEAFKITRVPTPLYRGSAIQDPSCSYRIVAIAPDQSESSASEKIIPAMKEQKETVSCRLLVKVGEIDSYTSDGAKVRFSEPTDLAFMNGHLYVTDSGSKSILVVDPRGGTVRSIRAESFGYEGAWGTPWGIGAFEGEDKVAATFLGSPKVRVFSGSGELLRDIEVSPPKGGGSRKAPHLMDVDIDDAGNLWVSDAANARIVKLDGEGNRLFEIDGSSPVGGKMIRTPTFLDCGADTGDVRVVDPRSSTTHVISKEGKLLDDEAKPGAGSGLQLPKGICRTRGGEYLVVDGILQNIQVYNGGGVLCSTYSRGHLESLGIKAPVSIALDPASDKLFVLSKLYGAIHVLQLTHQPTP